MQKDKRPQRNRVSCIYFDGEVGVILQKESEHNQYCPWGDGEHDRNTETQTIAAAEVDVSECQT